MQSFEQEVAQRGRLAQVAETADPGPTTGSVSGVPPDSEVGPTSNTENPPTANAIEPSDHGNFAGGQSNVNQATAPAGSGTAVDSLAPSDAETDSQVQPGQQVFNSELPPPLSGIITITRKADGGAVADVYVGLWENNGTTKVVAIKDIRCTDGATDERFQLRIRREAVIWGAASDPNILEFFGCGKVEGIPGLKLISPWCMHGNLTTYITNTPGITRAQKIDLLCGAARGLLYLHSKTPLIIHGDIKPENVVIKDDLKAALCDFGLSRIILALGHRTGLTTTGNKVGGTGGYQAKEILTGGIPTAAVDVYAFGGLILAAMTGKGPHWKKKTDAGRQFATLSDQVPVPKDHTGLPETDSLWGLLRECWSSEPEDRPTIGVVLQRLESEM